MSKTTEELVENELWATGDNAPPLCIEAKPVIRRIGVHGVYWQTSAGYYVCNPQRGFVLVPATSRGLCEAIAEADAAALARC